jgi:H+/Cl- antiporter ClcA
MLPAVSGVRVLAVTNRSEPAPQMAGADYLRLVALGAAIGIPAALVGAGFLGFVHGLEDRLWKVLPGEPGHEPAYLVLGLPLAGALIVVLARRLLPGDGGHRPLKGLGGGAVPVSHAPGIALAAIGSLGFGAVLGPEAPVIALGSVVGVAMSRLARLDERATTVLGTAGSFSAISALFGGPLVAGMLMVEGALEMGSRVLAILLPGLVAAAIGYLIFVGLGDWGGLNAPGLVVGDLPAYEGTHVLDLLVGLAVGVVTALLIVWVKGVATRIEADGTRRLGMPVLLLAGGLAIGALAQLADLLGATSQDVLFSGQASVLVEVGANTTKVVLILLVAKTLAYAVSLGCGFRGGPIFPAVFMGVGLASLPVVWFDTSPTLAVAVGAAAGMAAQTRLLFAPLLFALLLVGKPGLDATPAAVFAAVAAWLTVAALDARDQ